MSLNDTIDTRTEKHLLTFAEIEIGRQFPASQVRFTAEQVETFESCLGLPRDMFPATAGSADARQVVPLFLLNEFYSLKRHIRIPPGTLHAQEHIESLGPVYVDEDLTVEITVADKYIKNGNKFVMMKQTASRLAERKPVIRITRLFCWAA